MRKVKLVYNSIAGQSKFTYSLDAVIERFMQNDIGVIIYRAGKKDNLEEFLKDSDSEEIYGIVVAGGDGTINRVVNIMMKHNVKTPLGIIPAGTSNDFARHINMPSSYVESVEEILKNNVSSVDVGQANDVYFINVCSAGIFTNSSQKVAPGLKQTLGKASYFITGAKELFKFKPFTINIQVDDETFSEKVLLFLIFNGSSVGGMTNLTSDPSIKDGLLDLVIIKNTNISEVPRVLGKILSGNLEDSNIIYRKAKNIKIEKIDGECGKPDVDGDECPDFPLEVKCIENGINMFL